MSVMSVMTQVSVGLQTGGQAYSEIIFFQNEDTFNSFTAGDFELSADASAVALTAGAQAQAGTKGASASAADKCRGNRSRLSCNLVPRDGYFHHRQGRFDGAGSGWRSGLQIHAGRSVILARYECRKRTKAPRGAFVVC